MPYIRPNASALVNQIVQDMSSALGFQILEGTREYAIAYATALLVDDQYSYQDYCYLQCTVATATSPFLDMWAALKNVTRLAAAPAQGTIAFSGTAGALAPSGTQVLLANNLTYQTTADFTVGITTSVPLSCTTNGAASNAPVTAPVSLSSSVTGITGATLQTALVGGADLESDTSLRTRTIIAYRNVAGCGSLANFTEWALATTGITRAWVTSYIPGIVTVYTMLDETEQTFYGFPQGTGGVSQYETRNYAPLATEDLLTVANSIWQNQPIPCVVLSESPKPYNIDITISGLGLTNDWGYLGFLNWQYTPTQVETNILDALQALLVLQGNALGGTIQPSLLYDAVEAAVGTQSFTIEFPTSPIVNPPGTLPYIRNISLTP